MNDHLKAVRAYVNTLENKRLDLFKINDFGKALAAELEGLDSAYCAHTERGEAVIVAVDGEHVALVRAISSTENGIYDRICLELLGRLEGATVVRESRPETGQELGGVTAIELKHERLGGRLSISLPHQPQEIDELFAALTALVFGRSDPPSTTAKAA